MADEQPRHDPDQPEQHLAGEESGNTVERQCWLITNRLIKDNVDVGVDFHTGGTGSDFARFVFTYAKDAGSLRMPELFPVDQIMADPGAGYAGIRARASRHSRADGRAGRTERF